METEITKVEFRNAMARVCAPVNVITTDGPAGRGGFTATAMCSVTDEPPTLLVCMNSKSVQTKLFLENRHFCVNVLPFEHKNLAANFAGKETEMEKRYASADWHKMKSGLPALRDAIVSFGCEIVDINRVGTHNILLGRVIDIRQRQDGDALLYFDRKYLNLPSHSGSFGG